MPTADPRDPEHSGPAPGSERPEGSTRWERRESPSGPERLERPIAADWLALRRALDEAAREAAAGLLSELAAAYAAHAARSPGGLGDGDPAPVAVVDVGAGTGANRAYLAARLPFPTTWTLLDHDPTLLAAPDNADCRRVVGGIAQLPELLAQLGPGRRLVTCSALLDLLSASQLDDLVEAVVAARVPALLALTVTGDVVIEPPDPDDGLVRTAFDAHQARAGRPGPQAAAYVARVAARAGASVTTAGTPWRVTASATSRDFLRRYLTDRADAAAEHLGTGQRDGASGAADSDDPSAHRDPADSDRVATWLSRRLGHIDAGDLSLRVEHADLLILPA